MNLLTNMFRLVFSKFMACCFPKKKDGGSQKVKAKSLKHIDPENLYGRDLGLVPTIVLHPPCSSDPPPPSPRSEIDSIKTIFHTGLNYDLLPFWEGREQGTKLFIETD